MPNPPPTPAAGAFFGRAHRNPLHVLVDRHQIIGGALLLLGVAVPFALVILAPVIVNIIAFHVYLSPVPMQLAIAFIVVALELILNPYDCDAFAPLFRPSPRH